MLVLFLCPISAMAQWEAIGPFSAGRGMSNVIQSPSAPDILFATAAPEDGQSYFFESTDGGDQWEMIASLVAYPDHALAITSDGVLFFSDQEAIMRSMDEGHTWLFAFSTSNLSEIRDMVSPPGSPGTVYATGQHRIGSERDGAAPPPGDDVLTARACLWTSNDGGVPGSWSTDDMLTTVSDAYRLSVCESDQNVICVAGWIGTWADHSPFMMRSTDAGSTWVDLAPAQAESEITGLAVAVSPDDPDLALFSTASTMYRTTDGGLTWQVVSDEDQILDIEFSIADPDRLYAGTYGSVLHSTDAGLTWTKIEASEPGDSLRRIAASWDDPLTAFACCNDGFVRSTDGGETWELDNDGMTLSWTCAVNSSWDEPARLYQIADGGLVSSDDFGLDWIPLTTPSTMNTEDLSLVVDPFDRDHVVVIDAYDDGDIHVSTDGGLSWTLADGTLLTGTEVIASPSVPGVFRAGGSREASKGHWMRAGISTDGGQSWSFQDIGDSPADMYCMALDPSHPDTVYAGGSYASMEGNMLCRTLDGGIGWDNVQVPTQGYGIYSVAVSPFDPDRIIVGTYEGVFLSEDFGATWNLAQTGFYVRGVLFDPLDPQRAWMYDYQGVWTSFDGGGSWVEWGDGLVSSDVNHLAVCPGGWLVASTDCASYRLDTSWTGFGEDPAPDPVATSLFVSPNPAAVLPQVHYSVDAGGLVEFAVYDISGRMVAEERTDPGEPGTYFFTLEPGVHGTRFQPGVYFVRMSAAGLLRTARFVVVR
jgi:photosystem II stability/assembly factor-like uncharacterized protein